VPRYCQVTTLGKLFTYMCLWPPSSTIWYRCSGKFVAPENYSHMQQYALGLRLRIGLNLGLGVRLRLALGLGLGLRLGLGLALVTL